MSSGPRKQVLGLQGVKRVLGHLTDQPRVPKAQKQPHSRNYRHGETLVTTVPLIPNLEVLTQSEVYLEKGFCG